MNDSSNRKVLKVAVGEAATLADAEERFAEINENVAAIADGEEPPHHPYRIGFGSVAELHRVLSDTNLRVLEAIAEHDPASLRELGRVLDRDIRGIHDSVSTLEEYGFVELVEEGRAKRPVLWYDELEISVPLSSEHDSESDRAPASG